MKRPHIRLLSRISLVLACAVLEIPTFATTRTVTSLADGGAGSLRSTIAASVAGDSIVFDPAVVGTITLTNKLFIGRNLTISGPGMTVLAINGNQTNRIFEILSGVTASITSLAITNGRVVGTNSSEGEYVWGGGVINFGTLFLGNCSINGNTVQGGNGGNFGGRGDGGGIGNAGTLTLSNCLVSGNTVQPGRGSIENGIGSGGGISSDGTLRLESCTIRDNRVYGNPAPLTFTRPCRGGGLSTSGSATLLGCAIIGNQAAGGSPSAGGGVANYGSLLLTNCTLAANYADGYESRGGDGEGGGLYSASNAVLVSCTIYGNSARGIDPSDTYGGGIRALSTITLRNTIVAGNSTTSTRTNEGPDLTGTVTSQGFNFIGKTNGSSDWISSDLTGSIAAPLDPLLGPLQDNGGPTPTIAPQASSAAIDNGSSPGLNTDQRGFTRPVDLPVYTSQAGSDASDIGAVEIQALNLDIGLRIYDGTAVIKLAGELPATSPFRITKNGTNYGVVLTATNSPSASRLRIQTTSEVKAVMKLP